ncbi:hypothetical protein BCN13_28030 [Salmonella enterica]|nr:hypothetical protein [Salmonella enterica]EAQ6819795.1 hypothetical protein [Salmonella enterica]
MESVLYLKTGGIQPMQHRDILMFMVEARLLVVQVFMVKLREIFIFKGRANSKQKKGIYRGGK